MSGDRSRMSYSSAAAIAVGTILALAIFSLSAAPPEASISRRAGTETLRTLVQESARYAALSDQDSSPMVALLHTAYARAYITAARQLADDATILRTCRVNAAELLQTCSEKNLNAMKNVNAACPSLAVKSDLAFATGWLMS